MKLPGEHLVMNISDVFRRGTHQKVYEALAIYMSPIVGRLRGVSRCSSASYIVTVGLDCFVADINRGRREVRKTKIMFLVVSQLHHFLASGAKLQSLGFK